MLLALRVVSEARGWSLDEAAAVTSANGRRFLNAREPAASVPTAAPPSCRDREAASRAATGAGVEDGRRADSATRPATDRPGAWRGVGWDGMGSAWCGPAALDAGACGACDEDSSCGAWEGASGLPARARPALRLCVELLPEAEPPAASGGPDGSGRRVEVQIEVLGRLTGVVTVDRRVRAQPQGSGLTSKD